MQCLLMEKNSEMVVFLDSNLSFTIRIFTLGLANQGCSKTPSNRAFEVVMLYNSKLFQYFLLSFLMSNFLFLRMSYRKCHCPQLSNTYILLLVNEIKTTENKDFFGS